ncbi:hypothetical protein AVEN_19127-1 [Araneus ventricosus]|uniref:Uncharacterized protein n=1 Tax=Araneus ventricosus TaxID=182803 RepID=A0A4Y2SMB3_ARAVE|nr:hypothetical protein AVEN_19127-1 [Araneus ventricosus]
MPWLRCRRVPGSNPIPSNLRNLWGLLRAKSCAVTKRPVAGEAWKLGEGRGMPAQVSPSSSDRCELNLSESQVFLKINMKKRVQRKILNSYSSTKLKI